MMLYMRAANEAIVCRLSSVQTILSRLTRIRSEWSGVECLAKSPGPRPNAVCICQTFVKQARNHTDYIPYRTNIKHTHWQPSSVRNHKTSFVAVKHFANVMLMQLHTCIVCIHSCNYTHTLTHRYT